MPTIDRPEPPLAIVARLRAAAALPEAYEEEAWTGIRWRIRQRTFAHVVQVAVGGSPAYLRMLPVAEPATVMTFRATGPDLDYYTAAGLPFFKPTWSPTVVGIVFDDDTDWTEVTELVVESYRTQAPQKLVRRLDG